MGWRWLLVGLRAAGMIGLFTIVAPAQVFLALIGCRGLLPPPFLALIGWLAGVRLRVEGKPAPGTLLLLGNHVSWLDILALAGASRTAFVAHGGLAAHGFLRWLCEQNGTVFIARERRGTVIRQVRQVREALAHRPLTIFPEGTTSDGVRLLPFKSALLSAVEGLGAAVTVQPVALAYEDAAAIAWLNGEPGMNNVRRILARTRPVRLTIRFLEPLSGPALADRKAMAQAAQSAISQALAL